MRMAQQLREPKLVIQGRDRDQWIPKRPQRPVETMIEMSPTTPQSRLHPHHPFQPLLPSAALPTRIKALPPSVLMKIPSCNYDLNPPQRTFHHQSHNTIARHQWVSTLNQ